jgi:hypothetical protein
MLPDSEGKILSGQFQPVFVIENHPVSWKTPLLNLVSGRQSTDGHCNKKKTDDDNCDRNS